MARTFHCFACGEQVEFYEVNLGTAKEIRCIRCGLPLEKRTTAAAVRFSRVLVADDSTFFTEGLETFLRGRNLAGAVTTAKDGAEAVERFAAGLKAREPHALVILDVLMPRLNGIQAAVAIRAVERGFGGRSADLLFLSFRGIDPNLQPLLTELAPAYYLNKGAGGELLGKRLEEVLGAIASSSRRAKAGGMFLDYCRRPVYDGTRFGVTYALGKTGPS